MNVGFIGTGTMGQPMVANLLKKGFGVLAWDVVPAALAAAVKLGATAAGSVADVAKRQRPDRHDAAVVRQRRGGVPRRRRHPVERAAPVASAWTCPRSTRACRDGWRPRSPASRCRFIDAPVSGGVPGAVDGTLAIMVGGDARDLEEARGALTAMGANVIHVGAVGSGEAAKLCNNLIAGVAAVAVSEAFRIAEGFGVDPKILTDVISKSSGNTWVMQHAHPVPGLVARAASSRDYAPGFMTDLMAKDLGPGRERRTRAAHPGDRRAGGAASAPPGVLARLGRKDFTAIYTFLKPSSRDVPV